MDALSESRSETLRGTIVALALAGIGVLVFVLFAYGRMVQMPKFTFKPHPSKPLQRVEESSPKRPRNSDDDRVSPGASGAGDGDGPERGGGGGGGGSAPGTASLPPANDAASALREVLGGLKVDPQRTTVVSISSRGSVQVRTGGPLTSLDGLPDDAVRRGILLDGGAASGTKPMHE